MCNCNYSIWADIIPAWLTAIGTIGAVLVALFLKPIKNRKNRPIIHIDFKKSTPYLEERESSSTSSDKDKEMVIRASIENNGIYGASFASLFVDSYYKCRKDNSFCKESLTPRQMCDFRGQFPQTIAHNLIYYYDIATIQKSDEAVSSNEKGHAKQNYKLFLLGAKPLSLGKGTFIVPLKFYSSKMPVEISYLKILWDSDDYSTNHEHFDVSIISHEDFNKLKFESE